MHRNSVRDTSFRTFMNVVRATINKVDDDRLMQEADLDMFHSHKRNRVERVQNFAFTSTIIPRDNQNGSAQSSGSGGDYAKDDIKGPAAEAIMIFPGGNQSLPIIAGIDDRRHRPRGLKPGESAQYDDIGQMSLIRRIGAFLLSHDGPDYEGKTAERYASLRHVTKKKQDPPQKSGIAGSGGTQTQQDFKHEGETVNTEVRTDAKRIHFYDGDTEVGWYDKQSKTWVFRQGNRYNVFRPGRTDLMVNSADEMAPFRVSTEGGNSDVVWARID